MAAVLAFREARANAEEEVSAAAQRFFADYNKGVLSVIRKGGITRKSLEGKVQKMVYTDFHRDRRSPTGANLWITQHSAAAVRPYGLDEGSKRKPANRYGS
jgi:hypothetical protein